MSDTGHDAFSRLLYPMLTQQSQPGDELIEQLAAVPLDKARESNRLRADALAAYESELAACAVDIAQRLRSGGTLFACGNGGSATAAADVVARFMAPTAAHAPLPAVCLTADVSVVTAITNDVSFNDVFLRQIIALGREQDVVVGFSTSGNSENVLSGFREASNRGMLTVGLSGGDGGAMATDPALAYRFIVGSSSVHRIQEVQATLYGVLCDLVHHTMEV